MIYNGYAPFASFMSYAVVDISDDRIDVVTKKVDQTKINVRYWSPSEGTMTHFKVVSSEPVVMPEYSFSIKGRGRCKEF